MGTVNPDTVTFDRKTLLTKQRDLWTEMQSILDTVEKEGRSDFKASEKRKWDAKEAELRAVSEILDPDYDQAKESDDPFQRHRDRDKVDTSKMPDISTLGINRDVLQKSELRYNHALPVGATVRDLVTANGGVNDSSQRYESEGVRFADVLGAYCAPQLSSDMARRAMSESVSSAGGYLVPTLLQTSQLVDLARNKSRVFQAGARTIVMDSMNVDVPKWTGDPNVGWHGEGNAITPSDATLGIVNFQAKSLVSIVKVSIELNHNSDIGSLLFEALANAMALEFDRVGLYGTGTAPEPGPGIFNDANVTQTALASAPADYGYLINARQRLESANESARYVIDNPREEATLAGLTGSDGHYLNPPAYVTEVPRLSTSQVNTGESFMGDYNYLGMGVNMNVRLQPLNERYADTGELGVLAYFMGDAKVLRASAFDVTTGIAAPA